MPGIARLSNENNTKGKERTHFAGVACFSADPLTTPPPLDGSCPEPSEDGIEWVEYGSYCYLFDMQTTNAGSVYEAAHAGSGPIVPEP